MKRSNFVKSPKSTILGIAIMVFTSVLFWTGKLTSLYACGLLFFVGLGFTFSGDGFINKIEYVVFSIVDAILPTELVKKKEEKEKADKDKPAA